MNVERGYFGLGDHETVVRVKASDDFLVAIWARNVEEFAGGVQVMTPPSQFRTPASSGDQDGLVLDVPAQTGLDLGHIGGKADETIEITNASGARVTVFLTATTASGAEIEMSFDSV